MAQSTAGLNVDHLRERLMAADPMQRVAALHNLECELVRAAYPSTGRLAKAVTEFVARGMPFYSSLDPHYLAWVERAVQYWVRLQRPCAEPATPKVVKHVALPRERRAVARLINI